MSSASSGLAHHTFRPVRGRTEVWRGGKRVIVPHASWAAPETWAREAARRHTRRRVLVSDCGEVLEEPRWPQQWPGYMPPSAVDDAVARVERVAGALQSMRESLWRVVAATAYALDWVVMTAHPERCRLVPPEVRPLVWLGTTATDQASADVAWRRLREADGFALKVLALNPLLGPVDLRDALHLASCPRHPSQLTSRWTYLRCVCRGQQAPGSRLDWVWIAGDTGRDARVCELDWVRALLRECREANTPAWVERLGACASDPERGLAGRTLKVSADAADRVSRRLWDPKGADITEWPGYLQVRQVPTEGVL